MSVKCLSFCSGLKIFKIKLNIECHSYDFLYLSDIVIFIIIQAVQEKLEGQGQVDTLDLGAELKVKVEAAVAEQESMDIEKQTSLFKEWDELREAEVQRSLDAIRLHQQKIDIAERLQKLTEMEEKLRYFEQEQKVSLGISRMPRERPIDEVKEEEQFVPPPQERGKMF